MWITWIFSCITPVLWLFSTCISFPFKKLSTFSGTVTIWAKYTFVQFAHITIFFLSLLTVFQKINKQNFQSICFSQHTIYRIFTNSSLAIFPKHFVPDHIAMCHIKKTGVDKSTPVLYLNATFLIPDQSFPTSSASHNNNLESYHSSHGLRSPSVIRSQHLLPKLPYPNLLPWK